MPFATPQYHRLWFLYFLGVIALVGGIVGYGLGAPFLMLGWIFPPARRLGARFFQIGVRIVLLLEPWLDADVRLTVPRGAMTVSNHRSHLDTFVLLSRISGVRVLCKHTLFLIPGLAMAMRLLRQIPVRRGDTRSYWRAMEKIRAGLRAGEPIHVFPEMTRCEPGFAGTQPFHLAPFHIAYQEKTPVVPIAVVGTDLAWPKGKASVSYRRKVKVASLEALDPRRFASAAELANEARRRIEAFVLASFAAEGVA